MKRLLGIFGALLCFSYATHSQQPATRPLRLGLAGLSHGHVHQLLGRPNKGDIQVVGIYEPNRKLVDRYAKQYGFREDIVFADLDRMLDTTRPEAVAAFGSTFDHLSAVQACAPRGIHVMVEKPLAANLKQAFTIEELAKKYEIHVLTNYETTWYPTMRAVYDFVHGQQVTGPIRKIVVHDGHSGPKEIGVEEEFLAWLTDPVLNGGGALMDFGCYGANLATWLMGDVEPLTVTAVTQQMKPEIYSAVDDEATIILKYPNAQAIIQASWNWPFSRKDIEVYGRTGYVHALDGRNVRVRREKEAGERTLVVEQNHAPMNDPFAYLAAVVRGEASVGDRDLSSLGNNVVVMRILDAAKRSAASGETVKLAAR